MKTQTFRATGTKFPGIINACYGRVLLRRDRFIDAIEQFETAARNGYRQINIYIQLAEAYVALGKTTKAISSITKFRRIFENEGRLTENVLEIFNECEKQLYQTLEAKRQLHHRKNT